MSKNIRAFARLAFVAALVASSFIMPAQAQRLDAARERALQECSALQRQDSHDPYDRGGGVMHNYRACMADHGQPE
jgi:hypothetical protein